MPRREIDVWPMPPEVDPRGFRTPDLLAASQTGVNGVLTCSFGR